MKTKKTLIIYVATSFVWLSLSLLANIYFRGYSIANILPGVLSVIFLLYSVNLLRNISMLTVRLSQGKVMLTIPAMFCVAILEILAWYAGQNRIITPKIYNVFFVSGIGLLIITIIFLIIIGFQYYFPKDQ